MRGFAILVPQSSLVSTSICWTRSGRYARMSWSDSDQQGLVGLSYAAGHVFPHREGLTPAHHYQTQQVFAHFPRWKSSLLNEVLVLTLVWILLPFLNVISNRRPNWMRERKENPRDSEYVTKYAMNCWAVDQSKRHSDVWVAICLSKPSGSDTNRRPVMTRWLAASEQ